MSDQNGRVTLGIFLLDDHEVVRRGLRDLLESGGEMQVVGEAGTVAEACTRAPLSGADVALLDVRLEDGSGVEVCAHLREVAPDIACLMLTSFADDATMLDALEAGARGYVLKQVRGTELIDQVAQVAQGRLLFDQAALERARKGTDDTALDPLLASLTPRERSILDLLADGLSNRQIADELHLAEKTVKNNMSNLLAKMGMTTRTEAAVYVARHGN